MDRIGRYTVEGELGRGGCGIVYLGRDLKMNRLVAIKTILTRELQNSAGGQELQVRLTREAQSAGSLNHPAIVTVYELAEENDITFFVMEYVDGPPLDNIMEKGPLPWPRLLQILREIASGLDFAHSKGIIHRDIKPANILISSAGNAKISDFGVAKILESASMTTTGMAIGTPAYMSPEQILTKPLDGRSDQFSLAVITFEMLTGRKPFQSDSLPGLIHQILSVDPPGVDQINSEVNEPAASILRRALSKAATGRYPTCSEFIQALDAALIRNEGTLQVPVAIPTETTENKTVQVAPRVSGNLTRAVLFLAFGLAVAAFFYSRRHPAQVVNATPSSIPAGKSAPPPAKTSVEAKIEPKPESKSKKEQKQKFAEIKSAPVPPPVVSPAPVPAQNPDPGPDQPATSYMGSPEGRFAWSGALGSGDRLVIVRNRVRTGSISGNGLPAGVPVQVEVRPADIRVMQQPTAANGFRLIVVNQSGRDISTFTVLWREQAH
jgi:serine/threonine protein kinase